MNKREMKGMCRIVAGCGRVPVLMLAVLTVFARTVAAQPVQLDIISTLGYVQALLTKIGPILSSVLFVTAGVFYALGQIFPSYKRATLHSMAIDIVIGAIVVAVLSVMSTSLAVTSAHLFVNVSAVASNSM